MTHSATSRRANPCVSLAHIAATFLLLPSAASAYVFGNNNSLTNRFSMSGNGRYVAFRSDATNLVAGDTNGVSDVFVLDSQLGTFRRVSVSSAGVQGNFSSTVAAINHDGTKVAFESQATNLVPGDTNANSDIFVHDLLTSTTTCVSVDSAGAQATGGTSIWPSINADGTKIAFASGATNLVASDTNAQLDVFLHNLSTSTTMRVSVDTNENQTTSGGSSNPAISGDGNRIGFISDSVSLVPDKTTGLMDIFVRDIALGTTVRANVTTSETEAIGGNTFNQTLSYDGNIVAFESQSPNLVTGDTNSLDDVFVRDLAAGTTIRASLSSAAAEGNGTSLLACVSGDGTKVAFHSLATNLVTGDTNAQLDIFVRDLTLGTTVRASVNTASVQGNAASFSPSINDDGTKVAFYTLATNLLPGDTNGFRDVLVHDLSTGTTYVPVQLTTFQLD